MTTITGLKIDFSSDTLTILEQQFETMEIVLPSSTTPSQPTLEYESFEDNERWLQMKNNSSLFESPSDDEDDEGTVGKLEPASHHRPGMVGGSASSREVTKLSPFSLVSRWETALENLLDKFGCGGGGGSGGNNNSNNINKFYAAPNNYDDDDMMDLIGLQFIPDDQNE